MGEVKDPGFSILPHNDPAFKDGVAYERKRILDLFDKADSACSDWAKAVVEGKA
jgi:hypothetical protein